MMSEEEKIDQAVRKIMMDIEPEEPTSPEYTKNVVQRVASWQTAEALRRRQQQQNWLLILGILVLVGLVTMALFSWKNELFSGWAGQLVALIQPALDLVPFKISPIPILIVAGHFLIIRILIAIFFVLKSRISFLKYL